MAMIACAECGSSVSSDAKNCPQCGFQTGAKRVRRWQLLFVITPISWAVFFAVWLSVGGLAGGLLGALASVVVWFGLCEIVGRRNIQ